MPLRSCPRFKAIKERGKSDSTIYIDFGYLRDTSPIPHIPVESAKGYIHFCESGVHLVIHDDRLRKGAVEVSELFYHFQALFLDGDVGLDVWFSRRWWFITSVFFALIVWPKLSQAIENLSTLLCMLVLVVAFSAQSSVNRTSLAICLHLDLCLKPSEDEDRAVSAVLNVDCITQTTKFIKQHRRKHDTENGGGQDTSLLNLISDGRGYGEFSFVLHPCMHTTMKLSNDGDEFFRAAVFCHDSPRTVSADHVKYLAQINISRVLVSVLFLTLLLQLSCSKHHVNSHSFRSHIDSLVRVYV